MNRRSTLKWPSRSSGAAHSLSGGPTYSCDRDIRCRRARFLFGISAHSGFSLLLRTPKTDAADRTPTPAPGVSLDNPDQVFQSKVPNRRSCRLVQRVDGGRRRRGIAETLRVKLFKLQQFNNLTCSPSRRRLLCAREPLSGPSRRRSPADHEPQEQCIVTITSVRRRAVRGHDEAAGH